MSGLMNHLNYDSCNERGDNELNDASYNYFMNTKAVMRAGVSPTQNIFSMASGRDFFGPFDASRAKKEAFLQGRGQVEASCAECEVKLLPESLFPNAQNNPRPAGICDGEAQQRNIYMNTRVSRTANSLSEAEVSERAMFPGAYETGYSGYNSVVNTMQQTRMATLAPLKSECGKQLSYATYGIGEFSGRYGLGARTPKYE